MPLAADTIFNLPVEGQDAAAKVLVQAGQKIYGEHVAQLTHEETVQRDGKEVKVTVSYGAGGARIEKEIAT